MQKLLTFFSKNISIYTIFTSNDESFNDTLTNGIVSFEQLGPESKKYIKMKYAETFYGRYTTLKSLQIIEFI